MIPNTKASDRFKGDCCIICHNTAVDGQELKLFRCKTCNKKFHHLCASRRGNDEMSSCGTCSKSSVEDAERQANTDQFFEKVT